MKFLKRAFKIWSYPVSKDIHSYEMRIGGLEEFDWRKEIKTPAYYNWALSEEEIKEHYKEFLKL